jgi:hypothetical protein
VNDVTARAVVQDSTRTLVPGPVRVTYHRRRGDAMADLARTVWTAPVRNLVWVAAHFGHR